MNTTTNEIIHRRFDLSPSGDVVLSIEKAKRFGDDHAVRVTICGLNRNFDMIVVGIDSYQAVSNAMAISASALYNCSEFKEGRLSWEAGLNSKDLGMPIYNEG